MPRPGQSQKTANRAALSFYNAKLRDNASLRRACADRHVLDDCIDQWKLGERLDGRPIRGVPRSSIIFALKTKYKLIDLKVNEENVIIWSADINGEDGVFVPEDVSVDPSEATTAEVKARRIAKTVERIRSARMEMESNRNGIHIDNIEFGSEVCRIGIEATQEVTLRNESDIDVFCTVRGGAARQRGIVFDDSEFELPAGSSKFITISFHPKMTGITKSIVVFDFTQNDAFEEVSVDNFSIVRYITIRAGDPDAYDLLKPTAPYTKRRQRYDDMDKFSNPVRVKGAVMSPFLVRLGRYPIPGEVNRLAFDENEALDVMDKLYRGYGSHFDQDEKIDYTSFLDVNNYAECMHNLLWFEEAQMNEDIKSYDLFDVPLLREGRVYFQLFVPGLAENRPSVLKGDKILIHVRGGSKFEGLVHRTTQEYAIMDLPRSFSRVYIDGLRVDVRFTFSRTSLRTSHQAMMVMGAKAHPSFQHRMAFPRLLEINGNPPLEPLNTGLFRPSQLKYFNRTLNQEQQTAVMGIVQSVARPAPYLIYGPPGTGKTVTLVESILQTIHAKGSDPGAKILVCAPSNTAVDVVVERLSPFMTQGEMLRLIAFSRDKASVPEPILPYTHYNEKEGCFITPDPATIKKYKIVAVTISSCGKLPNQGVFNHFTHVFIDEAGHAVEADALGCLASVTRQDETNPPATILAGDPKQLGPIIRSDICKRFGLEKSFLERLSEMEPYLRSEETDELGNHYDKRMIAKLVHNYRSHPKILDVPNRAFYDGDLIAEADITRSHRFVDWEHLPTKGFPIIFHGIEGEDTREANSPSWFNPDEAQLVKQYVDLLIKGTKKNRCTASDIGIITPYHRQVQKIRKLLEKHGYSECKVGSVEEFQGSERPVIIISTVRSTVDFISFDQKHKLGFLSNEKRFNVAVTRPQALLIMIGNPFTLEKDVHWESMIHHAIDGGGYTGVDYAKKDQRVDSREAIEDVISGLEATTLDDDSSDESDDDGGDFVMISHVTAQEGPAWKSEE